MSSAGPRPDWAALYAANRDAMYRVAHSVLRRSGLADHAVDAVQDAMESLMKSSHLPTDVTSWQAFMITAAKRRALDHLKSAAVRHADLATDQDDRHDAAELDLSDEVSGLVDRQRKAALARESLKVLSDREREVIERRVMLEETREAVAADLGVTPARISQITKAALRRLRDTMEKAET